MHVSRPTPSLDGFARAPGVIFDWARAAAADGASAIPADVVAATRREIGRLVGLDPAELLAGLDAALVGPNVVAELRILETLGAVGLLLPEVQALVGFHESCPVHHKDLWEHTLAVVARTPPDADLRWAALLHDSGKIGTRAIAGGKVAFVRHEPVGAWLARGVAARLGMSAARADRVAFVVEHHGRVNAYEPGWSDRAVRRLVREAGPRLPDLMAFSGADFTTRRAHKADRIRANLAGLARRVADIAAADRAWRPPTGLGSQLATALGLSPGPVIGRLIDHIARQIRDGELAPDAPVEDYIAAGRAALTGRD